MNFSSFFLLECTLLLPLLGGLAIVFIKAPAASARWCVGTLLATLTFAIAKSFQHVVTSGNAQRLPAIFAIDDISAPMLPMLAILHLLTILGTAKSRVSSMFCVRLLASAFFNLALVTCHLDWVIVLLLMLAMLLPLWELASRGSRLRGYLTYTSLFAGLLIVGWYFSHGTASEWAIGLLVVSLLLRGGIFPFHGWQPTLFQGAAFGTAMLCVLPLVEVLATLRMVLPGAPDWMLQAGSVACLITAVYCGGLAIVQHDVRRFYSHLCLSQTSLVLFAVMLATPNGLTAALCLWISATLSLAGLGFSIGALEARFGDLSLHSHHGYYEQVPGLAICFFTTGLASVGFPGTIGFVPMELLISGSFDQGFGTSLMLAVATMFNGLAIMRAYFALFTGKRPTTSVSLQVTTAERAGIIIIVLLVLVGGWFSPSFVASRHRVADEIMQHRGDRD